MINAEIYFQLITNENPQDQILLAPSLFNRKLTQIPTYIFNEILIKLKSLLDIYISY